jgi:uncharacterized membrane protein
VGAASVGFYSSSADWQSITGGTASFLAFKGWMPGAQSLSEAQANCARPGVTGGGVAIAQYPAGGFDGDYRCPPATPNFLLAASPATQTLVPGQSTGYTMTITPSGRFSGSVALSVSGLPAGATGSFGPNPTSSTSTLSLATTASTPTGSYPLTITATSGSLTHTISVTLIVRTPTPDFTLGASPASRTVTRGGSTTYALTVTPSNGFTNAVSLTVTGLPNRTTASFTPNPTTTSSTLSITTSRRTPTGTFSITITATNGSLKHTTLATLKVQ